jgi:hypothetical protein
MVRRINAASRADADMPAFAPFVVLKPTVRRPEAR